MFKIIVCVNKKGVVDDDADGDTILPTYNEALWHVYFETSLQRDEKCEHVFKYKILKKSR